MSPIRNEDDRPTDFGTQYPDMGRRSLLYREDAGNSASASVDRPTMVRRPEPTIGSVAWLYCRKGLRRGQLYQMAKERVEMGRATDCDIIIEDEFASGHHSALLFDGTTWRIIDFASTNGTFVCGKQLIVEVENPKILQDGDTIQIGDSEFVFKKI